MAAPDILFAQLALSAIGGAIGGFSGFIANGLQDRRNRQTIRQRVAQAISGEIEALAQSISSNDYYKDICATPDGIVERLSDYQYHLIRGEQEYMPVFRSLGINIGALPTPLPRVLVAWYTRLSVCIEQSRALSEYNQGNSAMADERLFKVMKAQSMELTSLIETAQGLKSRLALIGKLTNKSAIRKTFRPSSG
jgi:hypothetical protein